MRTGNLGKSILASARDKVLEDLKPLGAYSYYSAATGSQYIKFEDPRLGSLRIGDHKGREKYRYKWNLMVGGERRTVQTGKILRHFYPISDIDAMCSEIRKHSGEVLENYGTYDPRRDPYAGNRKRMVER